MHIRLIPVFFLLIPLFVSGPALCAETAREEPYTLGEVVVTSERLTDYIKNHPLDVTTVERKEIVQRNLGNVEEILKTMPGVEVYSSAGVGSRISIRGSGRSGSVLVLLNGRPLNTNQYGSQDLSSIPVDSIQLVSVFKPPVPVWLGPGGSDGAINIVTRAPKTAGGKEKKRSSLKLGGGSYGLFEGAASHQLPMGDSVTLLSATGTHRDGKRNNSDRSDGAFSLNWNRQGEENRRFEFTGRYYQAEFGSPGPVDNETPDARQEYRKGSMDARYSGQLGASGTIGVTAYGDLVNQVDRSQSGARYDLDDNKGGLKFDTTWSDEAEKWDLRLGGMTEWNGYDHTLSGGHERFRNGLNLQYDRRFGALTTTLGVRGDVVNHFGANPGGTAGIGWGIGEHTLLKARGGYTVNVPLFGQLYQSSHGSIDQTQGNPDLKKERIWSCEVGLEHTFGKDRLLQLTLFRSDSSDLISSIRGSDLIYRPVNIRHAVRQGGEIMARYAWDNGPSVEGVVTIQDSGASGGNELPYTPGLKMKYTISYTIPRLATRLESTIRYEGSRYSQVENRSYQRMDDAVLVDLKATQPFKIGGITSDIYVRIENLFDASYENHIGYPDDGIRVAAGVQARF
jgi:iron complex outermembrane receptor protein